VFAKTRLCRRDAIGLIVRRRLADARSVTSQTHGLRLGRHLAFSSMLKRPGAVPPCDYTTCTGVGSCMTAERWCVLLQHSGYLVSQKEVCRYDIAHYLERNWKARGRILAVNAKLKRTLFQCDPIKTLLLTAAISSIFLNLHIIRIRSV